MIITLLFSVALFYSPNQHPENQQQQQPQQALASLHTENYKDTNNYTNYISLETKPLSHSEEDFTKKNKSPSLTYQNPDYGIKIQYPNNWTFSEEYGSIVKFGQQKYLQMDDGSFVAFYSPLENSNDTYLANLRVYAKDLPLEIEKLSGKSHLALLDLYSIYFSQFLQHSNFTIVGPSSKTLLGIDNKTAAYEIQYMTRDGKQKEQEQQSMLDTFTIYNNKIYGLRYTSESNKYLEYLPVVKAMTQSFEITKNEKRVGIGTELATDGGIQVSKPKETSQENVTGSNSDIKDSFTFDNSSKSHIDLLKNQTLTKINEDRQKFGLHSVNLSRNNAAQYQAENILSTKYMSHLTTNGEKPYMLYSKLGGYGKLRQNVALIGDPYFYGKCVSGEIDCKKINPLKTINLLEDIMVYNDAHAKWHHRHNILDVYPTHVSLGIAFDDYSFALVQHFENNYINFSAPMVTGNSDWHVSISGTLLDSTTRFHGIEIYYDDLPSKSFYEKQKDPNLYQTGKLVAAVKEATNVGFATGNTNTGVPEKSNSSDLPPPNITMIEPLRESYPVSQNNDDADNDKNKNDQSISLEFDLMSLLKEKRAAGVYTIVVILKDQNGNIFPGGGHSIFYHG